MGLLSSIGGAITKTLDVVSGVVTHPVTAITKGPAAAANQFVSNVNSGLAGQFKEVKNTVVNLGTAAAIAITAGAGSGAATTAGSIGSKLPSEAKIISSVGKAVLGSVSTPKKAISTTLTAGAALVTTNVLTSSNKAANAIVKTPSSLANFGNNLGNLIDSPSLSNAKTLVKENPVVSTLVGAGAVAAIGGGVGLAANTIATYLNSSATKANTAASLPDTSILPTDSGGAALLGGAALPENAFTTSTPITASTQKIKAASNTSKTSRKRSKKASSGNISQRVNVLVNNQSGNRTMKNYIKREALAY